jgi:hypothetical protein
MYIGEVNFSPPKNTMTVEIFKIIYQKFKFGISQFTIPSNDSLVTIPIMLDGEQIDITIERVGNNKYVVTKIDL